MSILDALVAGAQTGALLPLLIAVVQQPRWSANIKRITAVVMSAIGGLATVAATGGVEQFTHGVPTLATLIGVAAASESTYGLLWKPSKVTRMIERGTSPAGNST